MLRREGSLSGVGVFKRYQIIQFALTPLCVPTEYQTIDFAFETRGYLAVGPLSFWLASPCSGR